MGRIVYSGDMNRKMRQVNELTAEHEKNKDIVAHIQSTALFEAVQKKEKASLKRHVRREKTFARLQENEMHRLVEIVEADRENVEAERAAKKSNRHRTAVRSASGII
jgi:flagellar motility protein MotE (MotC chaperone)